uniref:NADH-ubiquinone oxidoreductase chain 5 n=1 Tax=Spongospora subterranea TaxID=70186 RepID=A0A096XTV4_9EUKA|nr:NADH dehydrogenase subunit 5 [Spongospora subterranea]AIK19920.1 NADH dehydrogenase subunit 5 [Spongospora subterranea]
MLSLIIFLPLFSSICTGFLGYKFGTKGVAIITLCSLLSSCFFSIFNFLTLGLQLAPSYIELAPWVIVGGFSTNWALCIDGLSTLMFLLVTMVSSLVYLYSLSYMLEDPHLIRFSCYITLFTFFMLILVASDNLLQLFFGWEGVGLCSYLLINFWYTRIQANKAAIQALMVNKIGDIAVLLAISASFVVYYSVDFGVLFSITPYLLNNAFMFSTFSVNSIAFISFLLFIGAVGKSAQVGLHTWLPSAMEGPTPVSALIHAATMVTAGIFLIIRCSPIFEYADSVLVLITLVGALTSLFAATIGMLQNDLKRIIAYSTCSQLGYMTFACGISNYSVAFFHLFNHGFFKALLFLSAGSIIHGFSDEQDLRRMGGLGKIFPITYCMFLIGSLALMGFPFLTGFFSKDVILEVAFSQYTISSLFAYWFGTLSAFFTAFYSFRLIYFTFLAIPNAPKISFERAHESSFLIILPLFILGVGSIFCGFLMKDIFIGVGSIFLGNSIFVLPKNFNLFEAEFLPSTIKLIPLVFSFSGAYFGLLLNNFYGVFLSKFKLTNFGLLIYSFFNQKWLFDKIYNVYLLVPFFHFSYQIPFKVLDKGFIELFGPLGLTISLNNVSKKISNLQTGLIYHYTFIILAGITLYINVIDIFNIIFFILILKCYYVICLC